MAVIRAICVVGAWVFVAARRGASSRRSRRGRRDLAELDELFQGVGGDGSVGEDEECCIGIDSTIFSWSGFCAACSACSGVIDDCRPAMITGPTTGWLNQSPTVESMVSSRVTASPARVTVCSSRTVEASAHTCTVYSPEGTTKRPSSMSQ